MPRNGSGTYSAPSNSWNPAVGSTTISSTDYNALLTDMETALSESLARDGQTAATATIPFASGIQTDTIAENSANSGITVDGVLIKDNDVTVGTAGEVVTDTIAEKTSATGVTIDGLLIKDGALPANAVVEATITDGAVATAKIADEAVTMAKLEHAAANTVLLRNAGTTGDPNDVKISALTEELTPVAGDWIMGEEAGGALRRYDATHFLGGGGKLLQVVEASTATFSSGSTTAPDDDTIPQSSEGNEIVTAAITPASISNKLLFNVSFFGASSTSAVIATVAIFRDSVADAIWAQQFTFEDNNGKMLAGSFVIDAPSTSSQTYKLRVGTNSGAIYWNGRAAGRRLGGVATSGFTIQEIDGT